MASIIATLMQAIASAPLYCTAALRIAKKPDDRNMDRSARSHNMVTKAARPQNVSRRLRISILVRPLRQLFPSPCSDRASCGIDFGQEGITSCTAHEIGRAHVCTPVYNATLVCRLLLG